jgi:regulator of ribonuclease activity A
MSISTADLCDQQGDAVDVAEPIFTSYGGAPAFGGPIATVSVYEDNVLVRAALEQAGEGRVLVVEGGGSLRCALVGDQIAVLAHTNGWAGIVVHGCVRDSHALREIPIGIKALNTNPRKSTKRGAGEREVPVRFAGISFQPGHYLYADADGLIVSEHPLADIPSQ